MQQRDALRILTSGANVFLTGAAGSGKTHLLRAFLRWADNECKTVAVTASTGIAATHMGGMTIHSWAGMGIEDSLSEIEIARIAFDRKLNKRFNGTSILVIDEISMLHYARLDMVDAILRKARNSMQPFGGIQVVCSGDFFQLPPVVRGSEEYEIPFAFRSNSWKSADFAICYLDEQFRQTEETMTRVLNEIRSGSVGIEMRELLNSRIGATTNHQNTTRLYAQNVDVDRINSHYLAELEGKMESFTMTSTGLPHLVASLKKNCLAPEVLHLKINARVMFVRNDPQGRWVNGTTGIVESFDAMGEPVIRKNDGRLVTPDEETWVVSDGDRSLATIRQYPLRLAWAITIHKSQGMSLDAAEIDLRNAFVKGMGYVALSRVRTISGLSLIGINEMALRVDDDIHDIDIEFRELSDAIIDTAKNLTTPSEDEITSFLTGATRKAAQLRSFKKTDRISTKSHTKEEKIVKRKSHLVTNDLIIQNKNPKEIAEIRGLSTTTIMDHIEQCIEEKIETDNIFLETLLPPARLLSIAYAIEAETDEKLTKIKGALPEDYSWEEIRLGRAILRTKKP